MSLEHLPKYIRFNIMPGKREELLSAMSETDGRTAKEISIILGKSHQGTYKRLIRMEYDGDVYQERIQKAKFTDPVKVWRKVGKDMSRTIYSNMHGADLSLLDSCFHNLVTHRAGASNVVSA